MRNRKMLALKMKEENGSTRTQGWKMRDQITSSAVGKRKLNSELACVVVD